MTMGVARDEIGAAVRTTVVTCVTCVACGFSFHRPAMRGAPPKRCTDCKRLRRPPARTRPDTNTVNYRWAHAVTTQRLAIELARTGLRTALTGLYDGAKLEVAVRRALADLDAAIGDTGRTATAGPTP